MIPPTHAIVGKRPISARGEAPRGEADLVEKHLVWARMCPTDMCPVLANTSLGHSPATQSIKSAPFVRGRFIGFWGSEGEYPDSAGFFTISSTWQSFNQWLYAKQAGREARVYAVPDHRAAAGAGAAAESPSQGWGFIRTLSSFLGWSNKTQALPPLSLSGPHASDSHGHADGEVHHQPVTDPDTQSNVCCRGQHVWVEVAPVRG